MDANPKNPAGKALAALLEQALGLVNTAQPPLVARIDYQELTRAVIRQYNEEKRRMWDRVLVTQNEAEKMYSKPVIRQLVRTGALLPYRFGTREAIDREGNPVVKPKGAIYYRLAEIEQAIEEKNLYKNLNKT